MLFSILIAHYNNSRFLEEAIRSVFSQTYDHWEIVLVDDASSDEFYPVIRPYLYDERIRIFANNRNMGCGYTKRRCASLGNGTIMGFLDPDDALHPEALEKMVSLHRKFTEASIIYSRHFICDEELRVKRIASYPKALPEGIPYLLLNDGSIHHFASFKKDSYSRTEGISPLNLKAVDQDLYYRLEEVGSVHFIDRPLYYYRIHPGSISNAGKEKDATLWHYRVVLDACRRRLSRLEKSKPAYRYWKSKYLTRYHKINMFYCYRTGNWPALLKSFLIFPFVGGAGNLFRFAAKIPRGGLSLIRRSFTGNYEIKA